MKEEKETKKIIIHVVFLFLQKLANDQQKYAVMKEIYLLIL
jgi:hypothetical protein